MPRPSIVLAKWRLTFKCGIAIPDIIDKPFPDGEGEACVEEAIPLSLGKGFCLVAWGPMVETEDDIDFVRGRGGGITVRR